MPTITPKAYSYVRFSTPEQANGDSFRRQTELSNRYAEEHGLVLDTSLNLYDLGMSGFTGENRSKGTLAVFLDAVNTGKIPSGSFLLVESLDRLSRDTMSEQMSLFIGLINAGLTVVTLSDGQSYSKATINADLSKLMLSLVVMMRAHEESLTKSRRLKAAWDAKRKRASEAILTTCCPSWLQVSPDRRHFVVIAERADLLRRVYELSATGKGVVRIARTLNCDQVPTWNRARCWHPSFVYSLLTSRRVLGEYQPRTSNGGRSSPSGAPIPGYYPTVITEELWQKAQERRRQTSPGRLGHDLVNLFTGIIIDGRNKTPMRLIQWNHSRAATASPDHGCYLVSNYARLGKGEKGVSWRYGWFEGWFLKHLQALDGSSEDWVSTQESALKQQLSEQEDTSVRLNAELSRLVKLARISDRPPETLLKEMHELEKEQRVILGRTATLKQRLGALKAGLGEVEGMRELIVKLAHATDQRSRLRLRQLIRKRVKFIEVFPNGGGQDAFSDGPAQAEQLPCFKITFIDERVSWARCSSRNPAKVGFNGAHSTERQTSAA